MQAGSDGRNCIVGEGWQVNVVASNEIQIQGPGLRWPVRCGDAGADLTNFFYCGGWDGHDSGLTLLHLAPRTATGRQ